MLVTSALDRVSFTVLLSGEREAMMPKSTSPCWL